MSNLFYPDLYDLYSVIYFLSFISKVFGAQVGQIEVFYLLYSFSNHFFFDVSVQIK